MIDQNVVKQHFSNWLKQELQQRDWTQAKLIQESGESEETQLKSSSVSKYLKGRALPDARSCQKLAQALELPAEIILEKAGLIPSVPSDDWIQRIIDDVAHAVNAGLLSRETQLLILTQLKQEQRIRELEDKIGELPGGYDFHPAKAEELVTILRLAARTMGEENIFAPEVLERWLHANPYSIHVLYRGSEIVGYVSFLPLPMSIIELRLAGKIRASDIPVSAIEEFLPERPLTLYLAEAIVDQEKPDHVKIGARLISEIAEFFIRLAHQRIILSEIYTVATSEFSRKVCNTLGCEAMDIPDGVKPDRIPFKLDIAKSGSLLIKEYRRSLK